MGEEKELHHYDFVIRNRLRENQFLQERKLEKPNGQISLLFQEERNNFYTFMCCWHGKIAQKRFVCECKVIEKSKEYDRKVRKKSRQGLG